MLILGVFWTFWLPGVRVAPDLHLTEKSVQINNILPMVWKETAAADGLGEYYAPQLWSHMLHLFFGFLALLNLPFEFQAKLFGFLIMLIGFWGIRKLLSKYEISESAKTVGAVFFLLNTFFILLFDGGQLSLALSYAILPIAVYYLLESLEGDELKDKLKFAAVSLALSVADIRIVYLLLPVVFVFLLLKVILDFKNLQLYLKRFFLSTLLSGVVLVGFHAYWLLPVLKTGILSLPETYGRLSQVETLSFSTLGHSLLLQQPHWPQNVFGRLSPVSFEFLIIPLISFSAIFMVRKKQTLVYWFLLALISIFLSKGFNEPFGQIYGYLFSYLPGFAYFRDPIKFYFLAALCYSVLIAFSMHFFSKRKIFTFLLIVYFLFLIRPVFLGSMNGLLGRPLFEKEFAGLKKVLLEDNNFSRILWIPSQAPLGYVSPEHPAIGADRFSQKRPFAAGRKGTYETFNFLREAPYMGEIFDVAGIGYIAYPYLNSRRDDMHQDNIKYYYTFLDQLSKRPWLQAVEGSKIPLLKTKRHQDKFFITPDIWWVIGSDSVYNEATKSAKLTLSKNALIFAEEKAGLGKRVSEIQDVKIILNNKTSLDLAASFLDNSSLIFPANNLGFDPDSSGWWKRETVDLVWWRSFLQEKYGIDNQDFDLGGGWAVGEGERKFTIYNLQFTKGKTLLVRVMESSRSGSLKFYQDDQKIGEVSTRINGDTNVRWFEAGQLNSDKELEIIPEGDINVVNALAVLDKNEWLLYQERADKLKAKIVEFEEKNAESLTSPTITYQQINPTQYKVKISNLSKPAFLVFSQNYDGLWKMREQNSLPVYSLLNGFKVEKDGEYMVEFEPQKYVYQGLLITGGTLMILVISLFRLPRRSQTRSSQ